MSWGRGTPLRSRSSLEVAARQEATHAIEAARPRGRPWEFWGGVCSTCGETRPAHEGHGGACACERRRFEELRLAYLAEHHAETAADVTEAANLPARYAGCAFDNFLEREGTGPALSGAKSWAETFTLTTQTGLLVSGSFGGGKTHLAISALRRTIDRTLVAGRYVSAGALVAAVRGGEGITWKPVEHAIAAALLVLDDFGQEAGTEFTRDVVARVVFARYEQAVPTIITTNLGPKQLGTMFGGAVESRLREMCQPLVVTASDYRRAR